MSRRRLTSAATSNSETRANNGSATGLSRRRHSSRRATSYQRDSQQHASIGLQGPRGNGEITRTRLDRVNDIIENEKRNGRKGVTEKQVDTYSAEMEEARGIIKRTDVNLARLEDQQVKKRMKHYNVK